MKGRVSKTVAMLLIAGVTGCASGPFHRRKTVPPPALGPSPPDLSQTPLYSPEMSDGAPKVPNLPVTPAPAVLKPPPPAVQKPQKKRKPRAPVSTAKTASTASPKPAGDTSSPTAPATPVAATETPAATPPVPEKKAPDTQQAATSEAPAVSPIGDLMAGNSAEVAQTSHQAEDLIKSTREGVDGIKRSLSADEKKTVVEIDTFLRRAEQALKKGDVDGAYGLATKAKLLLDELTQK